MLTAVLTKQVNRTEDAVSIGGSSGNPRGWYVTLLLGIPKPHPNHHMDICSWDGCNVRFCIIQFTLIFLFSLPTSPSLVSLLTESHVYKAINSLSGKALCLHLLNLLDVPSRLVSYLEFSP